MRNSNQCRASSGILMTAYMDFQNSIASAHSLTDMYRELRRSRGLGHRGRLTVQNEDLLWLPRSAVVSSMSALDAYVHAVIYDQIPVALQANPIPDQLADAMASIIPIKNANSFREAFLIMSAGNVAQELTSRLNSQTLSYLSYQAPEKIQSGFEMIGRVNIFQSVAALWPGPNTTAVDLKRTLANYVKRRNQIAHEGDRDPTGAVRHIQPSYAKQVASFVESLVSRLNRTVYPNEEVSDALE